MSSDDDVTSLTGVQSAREAQLRAVRSRVLRIRSLWSTGMVCATIGIWYGLSRTAPEGMAPASPEIVVRSVMTAAAQGAAHVVNDAWTVVAEDRRLVRKHAALDTLRARVMDAHGMQTVERSGRSDPTVLLKRDREGGMDHRQAPPTFPQPESTELPGTAAHFLAESAVRIDSNQSRRWMAIDTHPAIPAMALPSGTPASGFHPEKTPVSGIAGRHLLSAAPVDPSVDILVIGVDSRLGKERPRADALHLVTVNAARGTLHITSIPRGTPVQLGYAHPSANIISSVRSARGRDALIERVRRMCGRPVRPYYAEVGFSQATGVLELLGFDDPGTELQTLRARKGYRAGDNDRSAQQGRFLARAALQALPMLEGVTGEVLLRAGLELIDTDLPPEVALGLAYALNDAGLPSHPDRVTHALYGASTRDAILLPEDGGRAEHAVSDERYNRAKRITPSDAERIIRALLADASASQRSPSSHAYSVSRTKLWRIVRQRGWLQIRDRAARAVLRDSICTVLGAAFTMEGAQAELRELRRIHRSDSMLFPIR